MFNSRKRNNDPTPWEIYDNDGCFTGDLTCTPSSIRSWETVRYAPRPEYDNNPNPILIYTRKYLSNDLSENPIQNLLGWLDNDWPKIAWVAGQESGLAARRIDHSRKVLTRLVKIYGTEQR